MATLAKQNPAATGAALTFAAAAALGDAFVNQGHERVIFQNVGAVPITVTVDAPNPDNFGFSGNALDQAVVVPAGATHYVAGPFQQKRHNDATGKVQLTYSTHVDLSVAVLG